MTKAFLLVWTFVLTLTCGTAPSSAAQENSLNADLDKIMQSFDGKKQSFNPHRPPPLGNVYDARGGTLIFFDNSNSTGKAPDLSGVFGKKSSNFIQNTLAKAKARLLGGTDRSAPARPETFSRRLKQADVPDTTVYANGPKMMTLQYDGAKTVAVIPPDTYVEVPFVRHIPYFFSKIEILANDAVSVTETIQRVVDPNETGITGIDRYFAKYHTDRSGKKHRTDITVLDAAIDGTPVNAVLKPDETGVRLALHGDSPLTAGVHVFTVSYLFADKIAEFENSSGDSQNFKELIWNVTGQHWDMPVTRAGATVIYPRGAKVFSRSALTGNMLNPQSDVKIKRDSENDTAFILNYPLAPYEGMIIVTNWSETDNAPVYNAVWDKLLREHGTAWMSFLAFLFVCSYYLATWTSLKKNQIADGKQSSSLKKDDLNPAVLHYALHKQTVPKTLFILLTDMAGKGFLSFEEDGEKLILVKQTDSVKALTSLEKAIAKKLFSGDSTVFKLTSANVLKLTRLLEFVDKKVKREYKSKFIAFHQTYFWFGILMAVLSLTAVASLSLFPVETGTTALICVVCFVPLYFAGNRLLVLFRQGAFSEHRRAVIFPALLALTFLAALTRGLRFYGIETTPATVLWFAATLICIAAFYTLLQSPSVLGKSLLENLEGYKIYLSAQDDTLLSTMRNADRKIKALYSKHLPFAAALDVDKLWTKRFAAFDGGQANLTPDWYKGKLPYDENFIDNLFTAFSSVFPAPKQTAKRKRIHNSD